MGCCGCVVGPADCGCGPSSGSSGARVGEGSSTPSGEVVPWALYVTGLATDRAPVSSHAPSRSSGRTQTVSKSANSGLLTGVPSTWVLAECGNLGARPPGRNPPEVRGPSVSTRQASVSASRTVYFLVVFAGQLGGPLSCLRGFKHYGH